MTLFWYVSWEKGWWHLFIRIRYACCRFHYTLLPAVLLSLLMLFIIIDDTIATSFITYWQRLLMLYTLLLFHYCHWLRVIHYFYYITLSLLRHFHYADIDMAWLYADEGFLFFRAISFTIATIYRWRKAERYVHATGVRRFSQGTYFLHHHGKTTSRAARHITITSYITMVA